MKLAVFFLSIISCSSLIAQDTVKALFIGNSYTHRNNMPQLVADFATAENKLLIADKNTPGGYTLDRHSKDGITLTKIRQKKWDYVVLQEQSQLPSFPNADVNEYVYPAAQSLVAAIRNRSECAVPSFYRTWGRKYGDSRNCAVWPPVCTYSGMDSLLALRYQKLADTNSGVVIPVGEVWKKLRTLYPGIELYATDESHPSLEGSFAAACCFYTCFYRLDPTKNSFSATLSDSTATQIKRLTKWVVFNHFEKWNIGINDAKAKYEIIEQSKGKLVMASNSENANEVNWFVNDTLVKDDTLILDIVRSGRYKFKLRAMGDCNKDTITFWLQLEGDAVNISKAVEQDFYWAVNNGWLNIEAQIQANSITVFDLAGKTLAIFSNTSQATIETAHLPKCAIIEIRNNSNVIRKPVVLF
ncbi:MAG: hypothetical protein JXQ87_02850 [Bacteroidia bacterium]